MYISTTFLSIYPTIFAENPLFFPDFPDWKKLSKLSLISKIGGNPETLAIVNISLEGWAATLFYVNNEFAC